jgi:septum formation protein
MQLVLASSSPYRRALLQRLGLPFSSASPDVDETPQPGEDVAALTQRLALAKARALAAAWPQALLIGSDQACAVEGQILGKPGNFERARAQLQLCAGRRVDFHTALVLLDSSSGQVRSRHEVFSVCFRPLTEAEIAHYLEIEQPWDCAGSFKAESLGIALFESMQGKDFHSLLGLPLISLCDLLREAGLNPLLPAPPGRG